MILEKIKQVFAEVFDRPDIEIDLDSSPDNVKGWNSLNHVLIISEIEKTFDIQFSLDEMIELINVRDIVNCIEKKIKA
jgi:acyl carrier protein